uniref:Uncharacterized protein n=1 Tax=Brassica oleracea TaxID=3712 RepID=A0A3P6GVR6_BRAOL|nr:unnamed protein product [Brassica oleracea]
MFLQSLCGEVNIPWKCGHGCSTYPAETSLFGKSVLGPEFVDYEEPFAVFNQHFVDKEWPRQYHCQRSGTEFKDR